MSNKMQLYTVYFIYKLLYVFRVVSPPIITSTNNCTGLFKMIVGVQFPNSNSAPNSVNNHHLTILFEGGMHRFKRQGACVSRNWRYESEPPLKPSQLTYGTNSIIVLMFVDSQRAIVRYVTKTWSVVLLNKNTYTPISSVLCMTSC